MTDILFQVSKERVRKKRKKSAIWGGTLLVLMAAGFIEASRLVTSGVDDLRLYLPFIPAAVGIALILLDGGARNPFGIGTSGFFPSKRPVAMLFSRRDWFVPYREIQSMEVWDAPGQNPNEGHAFGFLVELRNGRRIRISPIGGFGALGRYIKTEREMMKAYRLLKIVMEEVSRPENQEKAGRREDVVIPRERFEDALAGRP